MRGSIREWTKIADSGNSITRVFCPECGTPVWWTGEGFRGVYVLTLSSLDEPNSIFPERELWTDSAVAWCRIREDIESFSGRPKR